MTGLMHATGATTGATEPRDPAVPLDAPQFRALMTTFPAGVVVVTTSDRDGAPRGMTCTAVCSVSDRPASVLVCMQSASRTLDAVVESQRFALNLLHDGAAPVARLFSNPGATDRFDQVRWSGDASFGGPHLPSAAHAVADCRLVRTLVVGEHAVLVGEVYGLDRPTDARASPLVYGMRRFWSLDGLDDLDHRPTHPSPAA